jgi:hypothetical protein
MINYLIIFTLHIEHCTLINNIIPMWGNRAKVSAHNMYGYGTIADIHVQKCLHISNNSLHIAILNN